MLNQFKNIGVIGAGTMGIGIAEVAATAGHKVKVYDVNNEFAVSSKQKMMKRLESRVSRGKITTDLMQLIDSNIVIESSLEGLQDADLVIEAIVEELSIKQNLFNNLQKICKENTLFATNTSSISVTAIASVLAKPENMIGLHFFNPAPVMQLVEVIAGLNSSQENLQLGMKLCHSWNKVPVLAKSTPGFIVNRVARPFYGEALKLLQEQLSGQHTIDAVMQSCGFRMGPFRLMDLIGIDVNLAVSKTVYAEMFYDPRYKPSLIQQEMVYAGQLGKKSGKGFYNYNDADEESSVEYASVCKIETETETNPFENINVNSVIEIDGCKVMLSNGKTCREKKSQHGYVAHFDLSLDYVQSEIITLAFSDDFPQATKKKIIALIQQLDKKVVLVQDTPALIALRTVCLLINEAADAIENGVCNRTDVDLAMQKGVNYPVGLIDWAEKIGFAHVVTTLDNLHNWFGDDRYRVSPWLRKQTI